MSGAGGDESNKNHSSVIESYQTISVVSALLAGFAIAVPQTVKRKLKK